MRVRAMLLTVIAALFAVGTSVLSNTGSPVARAADSGYRFTSATLAAAPAAEHEEPDADEDDADEDDADKDDNEDEENETDEDDGETFESPNYDYTIAFDRRTWRALEEQSTEDVNGNPVDFLNLGSLVPAWTSFWGQTVAYEDAQECVFDLALWVGGIDGVDNVEQRDDFDAGDEEDAVIAIDYEYTPEGGEPIERSGYLRCQTIEEAESYLQTWYETARDEYEDDAAAREELLDGVEIG